jgi:hypothetical protein
MSGTTFDSLDHSQSPKSYRNISAFTKLKGNVKVKKRKSQFNKVAEPLSELDHQIQHREIELATQLYLVGLVMHHGLERAKEECMKSEIPFVEQFDKLKPEDKLKYRSSLENKI